MAVDKVYETLLPILRLEEYRREFLVGIATGCGSHSEALAGTSLDKLVIYLQELYNDERTEFDNILDELINLYDFYISNGRVLTSIMVVLNALLEGIPALTQMSTFCFQLHKRIDRLTKTSKDARRLSTAVQMYASKCLLKDVELEFV